MCALACGPYEPDPPPVRLQAMVAFPPKDTIRLSLPATMQWCSDGRSLLIESLNPEGSGVLLRVRYGDSLTIDSLPIVLPTDTVTTPGAIVGIRFFVHETPHGYSLDSGRVRLRRDTETIQVSGEGVGVENAIRIRAQLESQAIPIGTDTVPCNSAP